MWNDPTELIVAGSGQVYVAPVGTALPINPTANLNAAFSGLGFLSEDGVSFSATPDVQSFKAWQSRQAVRRELVGQDLKVSFALEQWNEVTVPLAFGGGSITNPSGGIYRYDFPDQSAALDEKAMVIDLIDGARHNRIVIARGNVTEAVETQFNRSNPALLPIGFEVLEPTSGVGCYILSDDAAAFATGS